MSPLYRRIGCYEIRRELGGGGMSDVYEAEDARDGKVVALKVPHRDPEIRRAERDGALLQQHLASKDSRVAQVYEAGEDDGVSFVAMEYVDGQDLAERLEHGPLEPMEAIRIAIELCDLLAIAHACTPPTEGKPRRGIVHGDLKPRNIRIEPDGRVRVVDFGIAKALSETRRLTHNGFGSMAYSSPERVDTGDVDAQTDLWSLAVVLYEMLVGAPPFRAGTPRQLEQLLLGQTRPARLSPSCPPALDAVLQKAFAPRIADRYGSAAELKADLERIVAGAPTVAESWERQRTSQGANGVAEQATCVTQRTPAMGNGVADETRRTASDDVTRRTASDDVTRRTAAEAGEATRRTSAAGENGGSAATPPVTQAGAVPSTPATLQPAAVTERRRKLVVSLKRGAIVAALALVANEWLVLRAAGELENRLPSYGRSEASRVWREYRELRGRSWLGLGGWYAGRRVQLWHVATADELTQDYLSETPTIRERGWQQAVALLRRAAGIAPGDSRVRARLRYAEGQLARINGEALLERNQIAAARTRFNEARRAFEEAARLRGRWPDPHLGLARVQAIAFADVEETEDALRAAERAGYRRGDREVALMADAYRLRAERMLAAVPGLPDEPRYLERVRSDCWQALELYDQVPAYAQVSRSMRRVHALLDRLDARRLPDPASPVPGFDDEPMKDPSAVDSAESSASLE